MDSFWEKKRKLTGFGAKLCGHDGQNYLEKCIQAQGTALTQMTDY